MVAREKGHRGGVGAEQLPRSGSSEAEGNTCASTRCATTSRAPCRPCRRSGRGSKTRRSTDTTGQDSGAISQSRGLCEARIRISGYGTVQWHRGSVEEGTGCFCWGDTDELAFVKYARG